MSDGSRDQGPLFPEEPQLFQVPRYLPTWVHAMRINYCTCHLPPYYCKAVANPPVALTHHLKLLCRGLAKAISHAVIEDLATIALPRYFTCDPSSGRTRIHKTQSTCIYINLICI